MKWTVRALTCHVSKTIAVKNSFPETISSVIDEDQRHEFSSIKEMTPETIFATIPSFNSEVSVVSAKLENRNFTSFVRMKTRKEWLSLQTQRAMIADEDGDRAIHIAVAQENSRLVRQLCFLMKAAKISLDVTNNLRQTPLHVAALVGNENIVNILLAAGASIHLRDKRGNTPLQLAVKYFNLENNKGNLVLQSLLSHLHSSTVLNITDCEGFTALHDAIARRNLTAVRELYNAGADINVADGKSGRTGLAYAVSTNDLEMAELLIQCGACSELQDYSGQSSLDFALQTGNKTLIRLLEKQNISNSSNCPSITKSTLISHACATERKRTKATQDITNSRRKKIKKLNFS